MNAIATSPDGIAIAYEQHGAGSPAIVLVHGWSCDRSYWREQVDPLATRHSVVAIDLAGHGESGTGRSSWTMAAFGGDVAAVVDDLALDRVVLVGHSMGGDVIVEAALLLGDRVRGLVWVDTYPALGEPTSVAEVDAFVANLARDFVGETTRFVQGMFSPTADPKLAAWVSADMASAPPDIALDAIRNSFLNEGPAIDGLARLNAPRVSINPDDGPLDVASLERHGFQVVIVEGLGHFLMLEDPPRFNAVLEDAIASFP